MREGDKVQEELDAVGWLFAQQSKDEPPKDFKWKFILIFRFILRKLGEAR